MTGEPRPIVVQPARVFTGTGTTAMDGVSVEFVGGRVGRIARGLEPAGGALVIKAPEATLVPGLIDCHVHLTLSGSGNWLAEVQDPAAAQTLRAAAFARRTLLGGITTIRTLGGSHAIEIELNKAIRAGLVDGPRIVPAARIICITGGHGSFVGREADGPDGVRQAVREQMKAGAEVIKFTATGGVMTPGIGAFAASFSLDELRAGVEEAHRQGRRATSHAIGADGIRNAALAGCDSVEHGVQIDGEVAKILREQGTALVPTLKAPRGILVADDSPSWAIEKARQAVAMHSESFQCAFQAGVTVAMGTDAGTPHNDHGDNVQELALMVDYGLSPAEALLAATRNAARLLGLEREVGTLEEGKQADAVLVRGNPLEQPSLWNDTANILAVIKGGVAYRLAPELAAGSAG